MLIPLFTLALIIQLTRSEQMDNITQVIFDEDNKWEAKMKTANESIFQVQHTYTKYCYVRISLLMKDAGLIAMADYDNLPNISLYESYKQGEKLDRISQYENRKTRFLKLKTGKGLIYIYVKGNNTNNEYTISISGSNEEQCDNDCSNNGICKVYSNYNNKVKGCSCNKSFFGNDCNQIAEEVFVGTSKQLNISTEKQLQFYYIDIQALKNYTFRIDFSVSYILGQEEFCNRCLTLWHFLTKGLIKIDYFDYDDYLSFQLNDLWLPNVIEDGFSTILYRIPFNLSDQNQLLIFALGKEWDTVDYVELQMTFSQEVTNYDSYEDENENDDSEETNRLLYIIIPSVVGTLITLVLLYFYLRRRNFLNKYRKPNNQQQIVLEPEKCAICLEDLIDAYKSLFQIECGHQFHLNCIQDWGKNKQQQKLCPFCRRPFNPDQIK
ncbi:unnamed protein product (macronuclear) [Paramecium tetraurelia]|uniref:RING-type E3 ubiquitin transferase n=1 Tax=Paramecium tetraurelia TaxID=5888 RepID=A0DWU4_PARTE|nr:uncharacterized protein GSPATT00021154001 [Paramecium tetraurelia]CAK87511.1 unnamed protein product [Paramecium tetraurelia]|eukprot:XP_001454908.1 hypothetical protein (macronuclear) [Paramecium tetraurelia strain d4-2]